MKTSDLLFLETSLGLAGKRLAAAAGTPWTAATPCTRWTLRLLVNHLIALPTVLARAAGGELLSPEELSPDKMAANEYFSTTPDGAEAVGVYAEAAARAVDACRSPGALTGDVTLSTGRQVPLLTLLRVVWSDVAAHSWDLARATAQDPALPDDLAEAALGIMRAFIKEGRTGDHPMFAPVVEVPAGASSTDRFVAFLGRRP
jgi:uncharacterized protein (TIGR03086 family)